MKTKYKITKFDTVDKTSEVLMDIDVDKKILEQYANIAINNFNKILDIKGFRKGNIPKNILIEKVGEPAIIEEAANIIIKNTYPNAIKEKSILIIDAPIITIKDIPQSLNKLTNLKYTLKAPIPPKVELSDYKKLAREIFTKKSNIKVTDDEIQNAILDIKKRKKQLELIETKISPEDAYRKVSSMNIEELGELSNDFIKTLGNFNSIDELKLELKKIITQEKETEENNKRRTEFLDKIEQKTNINLPNVLIDHEISRLQAQFEDDLKRTGTTLPAYLENSKKTIEKLKEELQPQAEKNAKIQLILNKIAETENIIPKEADVQHEVKHMLTHYKNADENAVHSYITLQMRNEMVFNFLKQIK